MEKVIKLLQELGYLLLTDEDLCKNHISLQQATLKILSGVKQLWEAERRIWKK